MPALLDQPLTKRRIFQDMAHGIGESHRIAGRYEECLLLVPDNFRDSSDPASDYRAPRRHGLQQDVGDSLTADGRDGDQIRVLVDGSHEPLIPREVNRLLETESAYLLL